MAQHLPQHSSNTNRPDAKEAKMASLYKIGAIARRQYEAASAEKSAALAALNAAQNAGSLVKASPEAIAQKQEELKTLKERNITPLCKSSWHWKPKALHRHC